MTPFERAEAVAERHGTYWNDLKRRWVVNDIHRQIIEATNAEVERRRRSEAEANQAHTEKTLLRNELMRLRSAHEVLAAFIEGVGVEIPPKVRVAMEAGKQRPEGAREKA